MSELIATEPLYIGLARAYNAGDRVSAKQIEKHPDWADKVTPAETAPGQSPREPSIDKVLTDVGDDRDKAEAALEAEQAKPEPRKTLVAKLEAVIAAGSPS